jgi:hypothetical protein
MLPQERNKRTNMKHLLAVTSVCIGLLAIMLPATGPPLIGLLGLFSLGLAVFLPKLLPAKNISID